MSSQQDRPHRRRRWSWIAAGTAAALFAAGGAAYAGSRKDITLDVAGADIQVGTFGGTVGSLLDSQHIHLGRHDTVVPAVGTALRKGETVQVRYGRQVAVDIDGTASTVWSTSLDAKGMLSALSARGQNISLVVNRSQSGGRTALPPELASHGPVAVVADGRTFVVRHADIGVDAVLANLGINVGPHDSVLIERRASTPDVALVVQRPTESAKVALAAKVGTKAAATTSKSASRPADSKKSTAPTRKTTPTKKSAPVHAPRPTPAAPVRRATQAAPASTPESTPESTPKPQPKISTHDVTKTSLVKFSTQQIKVPDLPKGLVVVKYHGRAGKIARTYAVTTRNGVRVSSKLIKTETTRARVNTVILLGTMPPPANSSAPAAPTPTIATPAQAQAIARSMMAEHGWNSSQFTCLVSLWNNESGWRVTADNRSSGAYGIPQSLPATKMSSVASDWHTDARTQIIWGLDYIAGRYGSPCGAWAHELWIDWY